MACVLDVCLRAEYVVAPGTRCVRLCFGTETVDAGIVGGGSDQTRLLNEDGSGGANTLSGDHCVAFAGQSPYFKHASSTHSIQSSVHYKYDRTLPPIWKLPTTKKSPWKYYSKYLINLTHNSMQQNMLTCNWGQCVCQTLLLFWSRAKQKLMTEGLSSFINAHDLRV